MSDPDTTGRVTALWRALPSSDDLDASLSDVLEHADELIGALTKTRTRTSYSVPPGVRRILLVDDEPGILSALRRALQDLASVDIAATVEEAAIKLGEAWYDLLIVDYQLTNGTAKDLIRLARRHSLRPQVYAILISGRVIESRGMDLAREVGANDWIGKPVDILELQDRVNKVFAELDRSVPRRK
jgi:CheY-like chemotaxis protein